MSSYLHIYLSVWLSAYLYICLAICISIHPSVYLPVYLSIHLSRSRTRYLSIYPSVYPSTYMCVLSTCTYMYMYADMYVLHVYIRLCVFHRPTTPWHTQVASRISRPSPSGNTSEMYYYGSQFWMNLLGVAVGGLLVVLVIIPVIYPLRLISIYEVGGPGGGRWMGGLLCRST